jgi:hypothetical protein
MNRMGEAEMALCEDARGEKSPLHAPRGLSELVCRTETAIWNGETMGRRPGLVLFAVVFGWTAWLGEGSVQSRSEETQAFYPTGVICSDGGS